MIPFFPATGLWHGFLVDFLNEYSKVYNINTSLISHGLSSINIVSCVMYIPYENELPILLTRFKKPGIFAFRFFVLPIWIIFLISVYIIESVFHFLLKILLIIWIRWCKI